MMTMRVCNLRASFIMLIVTFLAATNASAEKTCEGVRGGPEGPPLKPWDTCAGLPPQSGSHTNPAEQNPDKFAWSLFLEVNAMTPDGMVEWETWANQVDIFKANPDPSNPPEWDEIAGPGRPTQCQPTSQRALNKTRRHGRVTQCSNNVLEEVRMNREAFDYIVSTLPLWYLEGQKETFEKLAPRGEKINLPTGSIEVKANWVEIQPDEAPYFYTRNVDEEVLGFAAMHIISKDLPNWFWATFGEVSNPCLDLQLKVQDTFGFPDGPFGPMSQELQDMFREFGLDPSNSAFANFRLQGTQTTYTDTTGRPIILGNPVTEQGFQTTASCMTCHSRSVVGAETSGSPFNTDSPGRLSVFDQKRNYQLPDGTVLPQSHNGLPDPRWYFKFKRGKPAKVKLMQLDFVWSLSCANSITDTSGQFCPCPTD